MEQYASIQQLLKKEEGEEKRLPIYPPTVIQAVFDAKTGAPLEAVLAQYNAIYVQYQGTPEATRNIIPKEMRRAGLIITYMNMNSETITERANFATQMDNDHWGLDTNWSRIDELSLSGDISVSVNGTWIINGKDTKIAARGPKGDTGLTPWLKTINNKLHFSYDNIEWEQCGENIAAWFRFNATSSDSQNGTIGKVQISRDNKTWTDLSPEIRNYLRIQGYVASTSALPSGQAVGTIFGVGPTYDAADTSQTNPIYTLYVYDGKQWINNGKFTSIAAGVVQETGDSETQVMSQKATTEKLTELASEVGGKYERPFYVVTTHSSTLDTVDVNIPAGESYIVRIDEIDAVISSSVLYITYKDGTANGGKSITKNEEYILVAEKDIAKLGIYIKVNTEGDVLFTVSGGLQHYALMASNQLKITLKHINGWEAYGNDSEWRKLEIPVQQNIPYRLVLNGDITDATVEGQSSFMLIYAYMTDGTYKMIKSINRGGVFENGMTIDLSDYQGTISYIKIEGRWHKEELLSATLYAVPFEGEIIELQGESKSINNILDVKDITYNPSIKVGTIYNGSIRTSTDCLYDAKTYKVNAPVLEIYHAEDINVRISEYDESNAFVSQTGYIQINTLALNSRTRFVKISASYANRGYGSSNSISVNAYIEGDFGLKLYDSIRFKSIEDKLSENGSVLDYKMPGKGSSWTTHHFNDVTLKANVLYEIDLHGPITFAGTDGTQTFVRVDAVSLLDGTKKILYLITGSANSLSGDKIFITPESDCYIYIEGRWQSSEYLQVTINAGDTARLSSVEYKQKGLETIVSRNITKDAIVRSTGILATTGEIKPLSFIHMSDIHTKDGNYQCFSNACEFLQHYDNIKFAIVTGDLVYDTFADSMDWYDEALKKTSKPVLNVIGNHDAGQYNESIGLTSVGTDQQVYDKYISPYIENWGLNNNGSGVSHPDNKSYYYTDFTDEKIRLIVLCEFESDCEISDTDANKYKYSREYRAMRQEQVDWFINSLIDTPSDYGVIVTLHQPDRLKDEDNNFVSYNLVNKRIANVYADDTEWLLKIIDAYQRKSSLSLSVNQTGAVVVTLNINCNFSSVASELVCVICGHTHDDYIGHYNSYPNIRVLVVGANNLAYTGRVCQREEGTPSEDLFNVVNIDRNRKKISVTRIGADGTVYGQYRNHILMDYLYP